MLLVAVGPVSYYVGLAVARAADDTPGVRTAAVACASAGAVLTLFVVPWLLCTVAVRRLDGKRATAGAWSLAANSTALILLCLMLRCTVGVGRDGLVVGWLAWTTLLLILAGDPAECLAELRPLLMRRAAGLMIGLVAVAVGIGLFHQQHFGQCFNGDGTEFKELAQSLKYHTLPYWEIETVQRYGTFVANPTVINSYWALALQLLLGAGEAATRLPCWIWWFGIFAVSLRLVEAKPGRAHWLPAIPLAMALLLTSIWYTFYVGYYPYMADVANPGVPDALFTLLLLTAWDCLRRGDCWGWAVSIALACLVFYAGVVMFVLMTVAVVVWQPVRRRRFLPAAAVVAIVLSAIAGAYVLVGWSEGSLPGWWSILDREVFRKYSSPDRHVSSFGSSWLFGLLFAGYFLLGCGGVAAAGLVRAFVREDKHDPNDTAWDRSIAAVTLAYFLIIFGSGHKNLHYLGPLLPVPLILWLKCASAGSAFSPTRWLTSLSAAVGLGLAIFLSWPVAREPAFTLNRQLGAVTTFQTDDYPQACRWARIAEDLYDHEYLGWQIGEHTWADYSELDLQPAEPRPLLVTDRAAPPQGYELVFGPLHGVRLFSRDPKLTRWIKEQRPKDGSRRCPWIFRPIAISPRPR